MSSGTLFLAVFLACSVEAVEATTIVLAAGTARDWRSALSGAAAALMVLAALIAGLGPALSQIPLRGLRLVVGGLLLVVGLQWLRKAVLRAGGRKPLHDEGLIFEHELAQARPAPRERGFAVADWYGFSLAFKGVLLEGLEVVFIALSFGTNQHELPLAAIAAAAGVAVVAAVGVAVRAPLTRIPENAMKFAVGVMLTSFGMFWGSEGAGSRWPGSDAALVVLLPSVAAASLGMAALLRVSSRQPDTVSS